MKSNNNIDKMIYMRLTHSHDIFHATWHFTHCANIHTVLFPRFSSESLNGNFSAQVWRIWLECSPIRMHALEVECQPIMMIYKETKIMYHWFINKNTCIIYKMCNLFVPEFKTYTCQRKCDKSPIK